MPQLGPAEVLVILVVALLVFGPKRLPEVGRQVGRGLRELRKIQDTVRDEINSVIHHEDDEPPSYANLPASTPAPIAGSGRPAPSRFRPSETPAAEAPPPPALAPPPPAADPPSPHHRAAPTHRHGSARPATDPAP